MEGRLVFPLPPEEPLSRVQRWAHAIAVLTALLGFALGFLLKAQIVGATTPFRDLAAGVLAQYPAGWLLDTQGDYVFRARDPGAPGYRTTLQVALVPIGPDATSRSIVDGLTLERAQTLAGYQVNGTEPFTLPDGDEATRLEYAYAETESNPFLQSLPVVVRGVDIVTIKRGQAIIITFRVEQDRFEDEFWRLEQFLATLELL